MTNTFGTRLWYLLKQKGILRKTFAKQIGVDTANIYRYINHEQNPRHQIICKICEPFTPEERYWLVFGDRYIPNATNAPPKASSA